MANVKSEGSISLWAPVPELPAPAAADSRPADLLVIGGGMAGLSVAYEALRKGRRVMVVDRGAIGGGMTARTTAHLASALDDRYCEFIKLRGEEEARLLLRSLQASIDRIEQICRLEDIDCDFARCDGYLFAGKPGDEDLLEREYDACRRIGFDGVAWDASVPAFQSGRCLRFANQARFHPLRYLAGLVRSLLIGGAVLRAHSPVVSVSQDSGGVAAHLANGEIIPARDIVLATNSPIAGRLTLHTKMAPYRTYAMAFAVARGSVPDALYWDTLDAYHYVRLQPDEEQDWLIVGGEDHKTGEADDAPRRFGALESWTRARFNAGEPAYRWSGQVLEPVDHAGFVGRDPDHDHLWLVTGDSGQGITNGAVAGLLLPALMEDGDHPWRRLHDPARISVKAAGTFVEENVTAVKSMGEHLGGTVLPSESALAPGEGGLAWDGMAKIGVYRDEDGALHRISATCTHAGCVVHFNSFERCWDCPCHGSHFGVDGEVLNAPATKALAPHPAKA